MSGLYAVAGALLVLAGCCSQDGVTRPVRLGLVLLGLVLIIAAVVASLVTATVA